MGHIIIIMETHQLLCALAGVVQCAHIHHRLPRDAMAMLEAAESPTLARGLALALAGARRPRTRDVLPAKVERREAAAPRLSRSVQGREPRCLRPTTTRPARHARPTSAQRRRSCRRRLVRASRQRSLRYSCSSSSSAHSSANASMSKSSLGSINEAESQLRRASRPSSSSPLRNLSSALLEIAVFTSSSRLFAR